MYNTYSVRSRDQRQECADITIEESEVDSVSLKRNWRGQTIDGELINNWRAVVFSKDTQRLTVRNCIVHDSGGEGINPGPGSVDVLIEGCRSYNNRSNQYYINWAQNVIIRNCLAYCTEDHVSQFELENGIPLRDEVQYASKGYNDSDLSKNCQIYNNLIVNCLNGFQISRDANMDNFYIANNTIVNCRRGVQLFTKTEDRTWRNSTFQNNIVSGGNQVIPNHQGIDWSHNAWNEQPPNTAQNATNVIGNLELVSPNQPTIAQLEPENYALRSTSPCIDAGALDGVILTDYFGHRRGTNGIDIGFHEYAEEIVGSGVTIPIRILQIGVRLGFVHT